MFKTAKIANKVARSGVRDITDKRRADISDEELQQKKKQLQDLYNKLNPKSTLKPEPKEEEFDPESLGGGEIDYSQRQHPYYKQVHSHPSGSWDERQRGGVPEFSGTLKNRVEKIESRLHYIDRALYALHKKLEEEYQEKKWDY